MLVCLINPGPAVLVACITLKKLTECLLRPIHLFHSVVTLRECQKQQMYTDINPFKPNGFFHSYYLEKSILHFRGVRLIVSS